LSIPGKNYKLKAKISKLIMEQELKNKHYQKKTVQQYITKVKQYLQKKLSLLFYLLLISRITSRILKERKFIHCKHDRKIKQLRNCMQDPKAQELDTMKNLHNFSSLQLTNQQQQAIARGLDVHIPHIKYRRCKPHLKRNLTFHICLLVAVVVQLFCLAPITGKASEKQYFTKHCSVRGQD